MALSHHFLEIRPLFPKLQVLFRIVCAITTQDAAKNGFQLEVSGCRISELLGPVTNPENLIPL
jgi:hypothetical protein